MILVAAGSGVLLVGGLWLAITSLEPVPKAAGRAVIQFAAIDRRRLLAAAAAATVALVLTRWIVAAVAAAAIGWVLSSTARRERRRADRRTEAIALWAEMLRDAIGASRGLEGVLVATAATSPIEIRPQVQSMAQRLRHQPLADALEQLGDDLDHPIGDLVITALRLSSTAGGRQTREVLGSLASAAYAEADASRRVEVARERPRSAMKYTAIVIGGFVTLLLVFSRQYLEPYNSPVGQVVLVLVGFYWAAGFWWMQRMGAIKAIERPPRTSDALGRSGSPDTPIVDLDRS